MKPIALALVVLVACGSGAGAVALLHHPGAGSPPGSMPGVADRATTAAAAHASTAGISADNAAQALPASDRWPDSAPTPEQVMYAQSSLLAREVAGLRPRTPGKVNLYAIAFAGDGGEDVFRNEAEYFGRLFTRRLGAAGHVVVLENNPASLDARPLATWSNLEAALDALAARMDPAQDILLVYFTSHGSGDHTLLVDMDPLPLDQIGAHDLPGILNEHPFKYKVVVVNACYSGGFIPPLANPGTMVITAARADRSSFGCGEQAELTWFGHAFLVDALNRTDDFRTAFQLARAEVAGWERRDAYAASDPQISAGAGVSAQLGKWRSGFTAGPAVPFSAAAAATGATR